MSQATPSDRDVLTRDADWRRLDVRMLLVHPVNEVIRFLPALVAVFLLGSHSGDDLWWHLLAVAVPVALGLLRYATTRFRITADQLELRRGLVSRNVLTARLDRVRTVELTSSLIHRLLGLAKVQVGTGSARKGGEDRFALDSLGVGEARSLRHALLHRASVADDASTDRTAGTATGERVSAPEPDERLLAFDPAWIRFAPLTTGGLLIVVAALAAGNQLIGPAIQRFSDNVDLGKPAHLGFAIIGAVVAFVVVISVLSIIGYVLANWGFTLTRDPAGRSVHIRKGLLTTRETSLELVRVRGLEIHEPLGLRLARGARLAAIVTGLSRKEAGSTALAPAAPASVVADTAAALLREDTALTMPLSGHGPRAVRRRYSRALGVALVLAVVWVVIVLALDWSPLWWVLAVLPVTLAVPLAHDRAGRLGHGLTPRFLVSRAHCFQGRRVVLEREGIIGWNLDQTWFQRRAGLVTMTATTAAGKQGYRLIDVPEAQAVALADEATPGLVTEFLATEAQAQISRR